MKDFPEKLNPGQIYKIILDKYNHFQKGDYFIVLSTGFKCDTAGAWLVGIFWRCGMETDDWGGARQTEIYFNEIKEISEYIGILPELIKEAK